MDDELTPIPISALEHFSYCPRQCALIHVEQVFDDNVFTVRGVLDHERVDEQAHETRPGVRREFGLPLWSDRIGLIGRADVVEFRDDAIYPVEHKSGRKRRWDHEAIQLCAQALCLEEMMGVAVHVGAVYYRGSHGRREIEFTNTLRTEVEDTTRRVRELLQTSRLPTPPNDTRCPQCSLWNRCLPGISNHRRRALAHRAITYRLPAASDDDELPTDNSP